MIRRDVPLADRPEKWLLLSQVEHARLSFELAEAWGGGRVPEVVCEPDDTNPHLLEVRRELLAAVRHHDDGWAAWEAIPDLDPDHHRPYSFMELPRHQSLPLWRDSILHARQIGPLAAWVVAGHFVRLLNDSQDAHCELSELWLADVANLRSTWLNEWHSLNRPVHTPRLAAECLEWLRLFDWISLWICMRGPARDGDDSRDTTTLDEGNLASVPVVVTAAGMQPAGESRQLRFAPWPFRAASLAIDALGYAVSAKPYATPGELAKSRSPMRLRWHLVPAV